MIYIPDDIWNYIKTYIFKTEEMKKYDDFTLLYNYSVKLVKTITFAGEPMEQMMFDMWSFNKKISFIQNFLLKDQHKIILDGLHN
tara:strand:- start:249 stop:503 length:255 start_codon:yes stop_codon:yes gene_type:complete